MSGSLDGALALVIGRNTEIHTCIYMNKAIKHRSATSAGDVLLIFFMTNLDSLKRSEFGIC